MFGRQARQRCGQFHGGAHWIERASTDCEQLKLHLRPTTSALHQCSALVPQSGSRWAMHVLVCGKIGHIIYSRLGKTRMPVNGSQDTSRRCRISMSSSDGRPSPATASLSLAEGVGTEELLAVRKGVRRLLRDARLHGDVTLGPWKTRLNCSEMCQFYFYFQMGPSPFKNRGVLYTTTGFSKSNVSPNLAPYATKKPHRKLWGVDVVSIWKTDASCCLRDEFKASSVKSAQSSATTPSRELAVPIRHPYGCRR